MRAELRALFSTDVSRLERWAPPDDSFAVPIRLVAGPEGADGEESFDLTVCSVAWLAEQTAGAPVFDARHHLVVAAFDWPAIRRYIEDYVDGCAGDTWNDVAEKLARLGHWEFEDYQ